MGRGVWSCQHGLCCCAHHLEWWSGCDGYMLRRCLHHRGDSERYWCHSCGVRRSSPAVNIPSAAQGFQAILSEWRDMETLSSILLASLIVSFPLFSLNDALQLRSSPSAASTPRAQPQMLRLLLF